MNEIREQDATKLTRDEFYQRLRMALSFYDNYLLRPGPKRSNEFYAETALLKAGISLSRSKNFIINELIYIFKKGVCVEKLKAAIEPSWMFYCMHE